MMSVQQILDTGTVDSDTETPVLLEAKGILEFQIKRLAESSWGLMAKAQIEQHEQLLVRIEQLLKGRHLYGSDEMTPLSG